MLYNAQGFALALGQTDEPIRMPRFFHFGIGVPTPDEVRAFQARLTADDVAIVEQSDEPDYVSVKCLDPDGYVVEVFWESDRPTMQTVRRGDSQGLPSDRRN
jgi:hypothetical protein